MPNRHAKLSDHVAKTAPGPSGAANYIVWDKSLPGFGLRIGSHSRSWFVAYRLPNGKQRRLKLGTLDSTGADEARRRAKTELGKVAGGSDPAREIELQRRRARSRLVDLLDRYLKERKADKIVAARQEDSALRAGFGSKRLQMEVSEFDRKLLIEVMNKVAARVSEKRNAESSGEGAKNYFRKSAHTFLDWCVDQGLIIGNPLAGYRQRKRTKAAKVASLEKGKALSAAELAAVWLAADDATVFGRLVRFIALTGVRREEAAGLEWKWIDRPARRIVIPAGATKMARDHEIPLTEWLDRLLAACPRTMSPLVFPSARIDRARPVTPEKAREAARISGWSKLVPKLAEKADVVFSLHDLRRSLKTHVRELGFDADIAGLLVGHARGSFEARYDKSKLFDARMKAAEAYATMIEQAVSDSRARVVEMADRREKIAG